LHRPARRRYGSFVRTNLIVGDLGDLPVEPLVTALATLPPGAYRAG
jgi:hypothetical protein